MNALIDNPTSDITLVHRFKDILPDVDEFFLADNDSGVVNTVNSLCNRIKKLADKYGLTIDPDKFKGDAFELFVEFFCKLVRYRLYRESKSGTSSPPIPRS